MSMLKLEILTPNGIIFNGNVIKVTLPGEEGEFGVLPKHSPIATIVAAGVIDIEKEDKTVESVLISWGIVKVNEEKVIVLIEGAVAIRGETESEVAKALEEAKSLLKSITDNHPLLVSASAKLESAAQTLL